MRSLSIPLLLFIFALAIVSPRSDSTRAVSVRAIDAVPAGFLVASAPAAFALPSVALPPPAFGALGTSAIPPGPGAGQDCSVAPSPASQMCSAFTAGEICTARNDQGQRCSVFETGHGFGECSTFADDSVCSVLGTQDPPTAPSACSSFGDPFIDGSRSCSTMGVVTYQRCSIKGVGDSTCSVIVDISTCSILDTDMTRSFCTVKVGQGGAGGQAKLCSVFDTRNDDPHSRCSVGFLSSSGTKCTAFGTAPAGSCSTFHPAAQCSFLTHASTPPCTQP